jgi:hypothetical protein
MDLSALEIDFRDYKRQKPAKMFINIFDWLPWGNEEKTWYNISLEESLEVNKGS